MNYQDYLSNPLSIEIKEEDFARIEAYAKVSVRACIFSYVPRWSDIQSVQKVIDEAIVMQIALLVNMKLTSCYVARL